MSDASRVEQDRDRDEHHPIGQRLMGDGKLVCCRTPGEPDAVARKRK
jgi:hypothetical protein